MFDSVLIKSIKQCLSTSYFNEQRMISLLRQYAVTVYLLEHLHYYHHCHVNYSLQHTCKYLRLTLFKAHKYLRHTKEVQRDPQRG